MLQKQSVNIRQMSKNRAKQVGYYTTLWRWLALVIFFQALAMYNSITN